MRIETIGDATLYLGDCREVLPTLPLGAWIIAIALVVLTLLAMYTCAMT